MYYIFDRKWIYQAKIDESILTNDTLTQDVDTATDLLDLSFLIKKDELKKALEKIKEGYYILSQDSFFTITQLKITHNKDFSIFNIASEGIGGYDLLNQSLEPLAKPQKAQNIEYYINNSIYDSGFEIGLNESTDTKQLEFTETQTPKERLLAVLSAFGMEMKFRFEIKNNRVRYKYIDIVKNVGVDTQRNYYVGKEIESMSVSKSAQNIVTALRSQGATVKNQEKPLDLKGYKLTDKQKENGRFELRDDKILDVDSNKKWSRYLIPDETLRFEEGYIVGKFEGSQITQSALADATIKALKTRSKATENYEVEFSLQIDVSLGDRINCIHEASKLYINSRVLKIEKDNLNQTMSLTLGEEKVVKSNLSQEVIALSACLQEKYGAIAETKATIIKSLTPPDQTNNVVWVDISSEKEVQEVKIYDDDKQVWVNISYDLEDVFQDDRFLTVSEINKEMQKSIDELNKDVNSAKSSLEEYKNFKDGITKTVNEQDNKIETVIKSSDDNTKNINALTQTATDLTSTIGKLEKDTTTQLSQIKQTAESIKQTVSNKADKQDVSSQINQKADSINQTVAAQYQPKGDYATTGYVASQIEQKADSITSTISSNVSQKYSTKAETETKVSDLKTDLSKLGSNVAYSWSEDGKDRFTKLKPELSIVKKSTKMNTSRWNTSYGTYTDNAFSNNFASSKNSKKVNDSSTNILNYYINQDLKPNTEYTATFFYRSSINIYSYIYPNCNSEAYKSGNSQVNTRSDTQFVWGPQPNFTPASFSFKTPASLDGGIKSFLFRMDDISAEGWGEVAYLTLKEGKSTIWVTDIEEDYDNSIPRYIGHGIKDSINPSDYSWSINPERRSMSAYAQDEMGRGFSLVKYNENLISESFKPISISDPVSQNFKYHTWGTKLLPNTVYTFSSEIKLSGDNSSDQLISAIVYTSDIKKGVVSKNLKTDGTRQIFTFRTNDVECRLLVYVGLQGKTAKNTAVYSNSKIELGYNATAWTPSVADVESTSNEYSYADTAAKYIGSAKLPYLNYSKYDWKLNPDWLSVNTKTLVTDQYSQSVQDLNGFKDSVGKTYQSKDAMTGYYNKTQVDATIQKSADAITSNVSKLTTSGINLFTDSQGVAGMSMATVTSTLQEQIDEPTSPYGKAKHIKMPVGGGGPHKVPYSTVVGETYSFSVYIKANTSGTLTLGSEKGGTINAAVTTSWKRFTHTFVAQNTQYGSFVFYRQSNANNITDLYIHSSAFVQGSIIPNWSESVSDTALKSEITQSAADVTLNVKNYADDKTKNAISTAQSYTDAKIKVTADSITSTVLNLGKSENLVAQSYFDDGVNHTWGKNGSAVVIDTDVNNNVAKRAKLLKITTRDNYEEKNFFEVREGEVIYVEAYLAGYYANYPVRFGVCLRKADGTLSWQTPIYSDVKEGLTFKQGQVTVGNGYISARPFLQIAGYDNLGYGLAIGMKLTKTASYSQIKQSEENITSTVSKNYTTKDEFSKALVYKGDLTGSQSADNLAEGWYNVSSWTGIGGTSWGKMQVYNSGGGHKSQFYVAGGGNTYTRAYQGSPASWSSWQKSTDTKTIISTINQSPESISISAEKINLKGAVTIEALATDAKDKLNNTAKQINVWRKPNTTKIDGGNIYADSLSVISSNIGTVNAGTINGVKITSTANDNSRIELNGGNFRAYSSDGSWTEHTTNGLKNYAATGNNGTNNKPFGFDMNFTGQGLSISPWGQNENLARNVGIDLYGDNTYMDFHNAKYGNNIDNAGRLWMKDNSVFELTSSVGDLVVTASSNTQIVARDGSVNLQGKSVNVRNSTNTGYVTIYAAAFSQQSTHSSKTNFKDISTVTLLEAVEGTDIVQYQFKDQVINGNPEDMIGFVINDDKKSPYNTTDLIINKSGTGFDTTTAVGILMGAIKELSKRNKKLEAKIDTFNTLMGSIDLEKIQKNTTEMENN
ncbi:hypothetical protein [Enterococcus sp. AZ102]|uniref:hypothetical protein n=1 Tax=Enterococcus sp. AZ102 TaxID=2774865 RepID=UPI003F275DEC